MRFPRVSTQTARGHGSQRALAVLSSLRRGGCAHAASAASAWRHGDALWRCTLPQCLLQLNSCHPLPHFLLFLFTSLPPPLLSSASPPPGHLPTLSASLFFPVSKDPTVFSLATVRKSVSGGGGGDGGGARAGYYHQRERTSAQHERWNKVQKKGKKRRRNGEESGERLQAYEWKRSSLAGCVIYIPSVSSHPELEQKMHSEGKNNNK